MYEWMHIDKDIGVCACVCVGGLRRMCVRLGSHPSDACRLDNICALRPKGVIVLCK